MKTKLQTLTDELIAAESAGDKRAALRLTGEIHTLLLGSIEPEPAPAPAPAPEPSSEEVPPEPGSSTEPSKPAEPAKPSKPAEPAALRAPSAQGLLRATKRLIGRLETSYQSIQPLSTALRATVWPTERHRVCVHRVRRRLFCNPIARRDGRGRRSVTDPCALTARGSPYYWIQKNGRRVTSRIAARPQARQRKPPRGCGKWTTTTDGLSTGAFAGDNETVVCCRMVQWRRNAVRPLLQYHVFPRARGLQD